MRPVDLQLVGRNNKGMEYRFNTPNAAHVTAFDLDHTLLRPKGGKRVFHKDGKDVEYAFAAVPEKLAALRAAGHKLVVFTNQSVSKDKREERCRAVLARVDQWLGTDVDVFIACTNDWCRKPCPGMYDKFLQLNGPVSNPVLFVGDAAGRPGDFSASDHAFAANTGMQFMTPDMFFANTNVPVPPLQRLPLLPAVTPRQTDFGNVKTVLFLIGRPACGKSTWAAQLSHSDSVILNTDTTGSAATTMRLFTNALQRGTGLIILDNTNGSVSGRQKFLSAVAACKTHQYRCVAHVSQLPMQYCQHLNKYRAYKTKGAAVPDVAFHTYNKHYQEPTAAEGFATIEPWRPALLPEVFQLCLTETKTTK